MGLLSSIGNWLWNGAKGTASSFGFDTSSYENDEAQKFQAQQSQMNRDWQEKMMENQMAYQTDMWNKTNEYNSASAVMQRYREAGLNPYMMMSGGNAGFGASSPSSPSAPSAPSPSGGFAGTHPTPAGQFIKNIADAKAALSDKRLKDADSTLKEIEAKTHAAQLYENLEQTRLSNEEQKKINYYKSDILDATFKQIKAQEYALNAQGKLADMDAAYASIRNENAPAEFKARIAEISSNIDLNKANAKDALSRAILNEANNDKVKLDTNTARRMADSIVEEAKERANKAKMPTNPYELGWMGIEGMNKAGKELHKSFQNSKFVKSSNRYWKDTKRYVLPDWMK